MSGHEFQIYYIRHGYILENGGAVLEGSSHELMENPDVKSTYFWGVGFSFMKKRILRYPTKATTLKEHDPEKMRCF
jgi:hypothetical protein